MADTKRQRRGGGYERRDRGRDSDRHGFTAFNMDDENDEGHFDENGNFIWKKEEKSVQEEAWLDSVSEEQIEAAKSAKDRKDYRDEQEQESLTEEEANRTLAELLQPRETVLQALQRLGKKRSKARGSNKRKQASGESDEKAQTPEEKEQFDRITEAADYLMRIGEVDVYSQMKEEFISEEELIAQRQQRQQEQAQQQQQEIAAAQARTSYFDNGNQEAKSEEAAPTNEVMWEYKGSDGEIHGPYPTSTLIAWRQQGYFVGDNAVDMRIVPNNKDREAKEEKKDDDKPKVSAEEELLNDFEDSDEEDADGGKPDETASKENEWQRSDLIDFASYQS